MAWFNFWSWGSSSGSHANSNSMSSTFSHRAVLVAQRPHNPSAHYSGQAQPQVQSQPRMRSTSTPGNTGLTEKEPEMKQVGGHSVTLNASVDQGNGYSRSRSVPRTPIVPSDGHVQAYAKQQAEKTRSTSAHGQQSLRSRTHDPRPAPNFQEQSQTQSYSASQSQSRSQPRTLSEHQSRTRESREPRLYGTDEFGYGNRTAGNRVGEGNLSSSVPSSARASASTPAVAVTALSQTRGRTRVPPHSNPSTMVSARLDAPRVTPSHATMVSARLDSQQVAALHPNISSAVPSRSNVSTITPSHQTTSTVVHSRPNISSAAPSRLNVSNIPPSHPNTSMVSAHLDSQKVTATPHPNTSTVVPPRPNISSTIPSRPHVSNVPSSHPPTTNTTARAGFFERLARPLRYGLTRTDSGSRTIHGRSQSVDAAEGRAGGRSRRGEVSMRDMPPTAETHRAGETAASHQSQSRGRTNTGIIHVVNRHRSVSRPTAAPAPNSVPSASASAPAPVPVPPSQLSSTSRPRRSRLRHHVSFANPHKRVVLHMNPLFATSDPNSASNFSSSGPPLAPTASSSSSKSFAHTRAPISYDVTLSPSRVSVRCRFIPEKGEPNSSRGRSKNRDTEPVPDHVLSQPATDPPTKGKLILRSERFHPRWAVVVHGGCSSSAPPTQQGSASASAKVITNNDVLHAIYYSLNGFITPEEWESIHIPDPDSTDVSENSPDNVNNTRSRLSQKRVGGAYRDRLDREMERRELRAARERAMASLVAGRRVSGEVGMEETREGVRRVDWLMGRTKLVGIVVEKDLDASADVSGVAGVGRLVFEKP